MPDLNGFVEGIATILSDDGICEIEVPYVRELIGHLEFDTIYHEHLCYFSVTALDALFSRHGLSINDVRSCRSTEARSGSRSAERRAGPVRAETSRGRGRQGCLDSTTTRFADRVAQVQRSLREMLQRLRGQGKTIAAYGAAAKGTILLNSSGIGSDLIAFVADKSPHKQGLLMPGVRIPIVPPERILEDMPDYVLLLAWNIKDEILRKQRAYLEAGGRFIVPIPSPIDVGREDVEELQRLNGRWVTSGSSSTRTRWERGCSLSWRSCSRSAGASPATVSARPSAGSASGSRWSSTRSPPARRSSTGPFRRSGTSVMPTSRIPSGRRVVDFREHNLHVVGYSVPVDARMPLSELKGAHPHAP